MSNVYSLVTFSCLPLVPREAGIKPPTAMKSGTTICGIQLKDAVILAADTRATEGPMVADKNCEKLHYIAPSWHQIAFKRPLKGLKSL